MTTSNHPNFAELLTNWRFRLPNKPSAQAVSAALPGEKNPQYFGALERVSGMQKLPSLESFLEILGYFSQNLQKKPQGRLSTVLINEALSVFGLETDGVSSIHLEDDRVLQETIASGSSIWLVSDKTREEKSPKWMKSVANAIFGRQVSYSYFLPFSRVKGECLAFAEAIKNSAVHQGLSTSDKNDYLRIYRLSNVAFSTRYRIVHPPNNGTPYGHMAVDHEDENRVLRVEMPKYAVEQMVERIQLLLQNMSTNCVVPESGYIEQVYP
jgi:hypothetical protein